MASSKIYELNSLIGDKSLSSITICNIKPQDMQELELVGLIKLIKTIKLRKQKQKLFLSQKILKQIEDLVGINGLNTTNIAGITPFRMDEDELNELLSLIKTMKLREKGYKIVEDRFNLNDDWIEVTFDYHPNLVQMVGSIPTANWNKEEKHWKVHISQWPAVEEVFRITQLNIETRYEEWKEYNKINRLRLVNKGCYLTGLELPYKEIHLATSFPDLNAKHITSYQNGTWDGRIALYDRATGFFPYGLLGKVLSVLQKNNIKFEYIDERVKPNKKYTWKKNVTLRDYQENTQIKALQHGRGILQLATGAGKTKTASSIVYEYGLNTIFFVHTKFLLGQAKNALKEVLDIEIGQVGDGVVDIQPVTVAMVQTTIKALGGEYIPSADDEETDPNQIEDFTDINGKEELIIQMLQEAELVFFDECQFVAADTFYTIANYCPAYYKYGLSATPYRSDKKDLMIEAALGPVIDKVNASYLIKRGFLTKPKIHFFKVGSLRNGEDRKYQTIYREEIVENIIRNKLIVQSTKRLNSKNKSVLILVQQVNHGNLLKELFRQEGMNVEFVSGEDDLAKREAEIFKLRTKKNLTLIATTIADEGLDVPSLDAVILGGGGKSPSKGMQRIGRAIRVFSLKEEAFEIFSSTLELLTEEKNILIVVDNIEHGKYIQDFFLQEDENRNKKSLNIDFLYGETFLKNKNKILQDLANKKNRSLIVYAEDINPEEINRFKSLDSILISGGLRFDTSKLERSLPNTVIYNRIEDVSNIISESINLYNEDKSVLILVEETKQGKLLKDNFKELNLKVKYLTGSKDTSNLEEKIEDLINKKEKIIIVNSNYINKSLDLYKIDKVIVSGADKTPHNTINKVQKDIRIFTKKDEAIVIDFIDNSKYLYNHSLERKLMFQTEEEFVISGWD